MVDQHLDVEQWRFIWILTCPLLEREGGIHDIETYNNSFFFPKRLEEATPYNNWFLRFPETCPSFLFQQFVTPNALIDLTGVCSASWVSANLIDSLSVLRRNFLKPRVFWEMQERHLLIQKGSRMRNFLLERDCWSSSKHYPSVKYQMVFMHLLHLKILRILKSAVC